VTQRPTRDDRALGACLLLLCVALFFFGLGSPALWDMDEGMHAASAREMVETGDWVTPRFNGVPFYDKPPLFTWAVALSFSALGYSGLSARLPAAVFGLATVLVTWRLGRRMFGARAGFLGAAALATSAEFVALSRVVVHDIALVFCTTLALFAFWVALEDERRRTPAMLAVYAASGLAILAKGPVGLLPGFVGGLFLLATRRLGFLREMRLATGVLVVLAIVVPWYLLAARADPGFLPYWTAKITGSLADDTSYKAKPITYYLPVVAGGLLPWSLYLPAAVARAVRLRRGAEGPALVLLLIWLVAPFVVFSLAAVKLVTYLLPIFPAAALLVGVAGAALWEGGDRALERGFLWPTRALFAAALAAPLALLLFAPKGELERNGVHLGQLELAAAGLLLGSGAALALLTRRNVPGFFASVFATVAAGMLLFVCVLAPAVEPYRSSKAVGARLDALLAPGAPMAIYRRIHGIGDAALFYSGRTGVAIEDPPDLERFLADRRPVYCIVGDRYWEDFPDALRERIEVLYHEGDKSVVTNRRPGGEAAGPGAPS
jgi:4-amino-4-deoxy-L-arabinose transferase-like glycosyltransferase